MISSVLRKILTHLTDRAYAKYSKQWTRIEGVVDLFFEKHYLYLQVDSDGYVDYTLVDIAEMTIQCPICADPIRIGDLICLYPPGILCPDSVHVLHDVSPVVCTMHKENNHPCGLWIPDTLKPEKKQGCVRILDPEDDASTIFSELNVAWSDEIDVM